MDVCDTESIGGMIVFLIVQRPPSGAYATTPPCMPNLYAVDCFDVKGEWWKDARGSESQHESYPAIDFGRKRAKNGPDSRVSWMATGGPNCCGISV